MPTTRKDGALIRREGKAVEKEEERAGAAVVRRCEKSEGNPLFRVVCRRAHASDRASAEFSCREERNKLAVPVL